MELTKPARISFSLPPMTNRSGRYKILHFVENEWRELEAIVDSEARQIYAMTENTGDFALVFDTSASSMMPDTYHLHQNYPNPFNAITRIEYGLPEASFVQFNLYNIKGEMIRSISSGYKNAGMHSMEWDSKNQAGLNCSSGIYILQMDTPAFKQTIKLMLLR